MRAVFWLVGFSGCFIAASYLLVIFSPMTYLKIYGSIGLGPFSLPWVVDLAEQGLGSAPQLYCEDPILLSWQGSFGEFNLLPENIAQPEVDEYNKLVLGRTDYMTASTNAALTAMSDFNSQLVALCF